MALKNHFDEIHYVDIMDCNAGEHGHPFATNFNPEINIREVTARGKYFEAGRWIETDPLSVHKTFDFPEIGPREMYLMYHEELESLVTHIPRIKRIRFWMTFGQEYLTHLRVLQNVGMTRIDPVRFQGCDIVPLQFLKALLPEPSSLGENYRGKTNIGCMIEGIKDGKPRKYYIYNVCDHARGLSGSPCPGHLVHHGRPDDDRRHDGPDRSLEGKGSLQRGTIRPDSLHGTTGTARIALDRKIPGLKACDGTDGPNDAHGLIESPHPLLCDR